MLTNEVINYFKGVKEDSNGYKCKCPAHKDKESSLSIKHSNEKTVIYCHAGCNIVDILNKVNLKPSDLYDSNLSPKKEVNQFNSEKDVEKYLMTIEMNSKKVTSYYKYTDLKGNLLYYKIRLENDKKEKDFMFIRYIDNKIVWGLSGGAKYETYENSYQYSSKERDTNKIEAEEQGKVLYNLKSFQYAKDNGYPVFIVEGEKDVNTMKEIGLIAVSSPVGGGAGSKKWLNSYSELFKGCDVVILPDNDNPGKEFATMVAKDLLNYCYKVRTLVMSSEEKGDITDWYNSLNEGDKLKAKTIILDKIRLLKPKCPKWYKVTEKTKGNGEDVAIVGYEITLRKNYFAKYLLNNLNLVIIGDNSMAKPIPHVYCNGVYEPRFNILSEIEEYLYIDNVNAGLLSEIETLMLKAPKHEIMPNSYLNGDEHIINFKNGLLNVNTKEFKPHTPEYKSLIQLDCNYNPKAVTKGYWDRYIKDLSEGKQDHYEVLQEMAGLIISNIAGYRPKKFLGLWGKGNTGKGKFWDILGEILGNRAVGVVSIQDLSDKFSVVALYGKTFVYDGDLSKEGIKDPAMLKRVTGGDKLKGEFKGKDVFDFRFTGVYAMACNDLPVLMGDHGTHMYNRIQILPCNNVIPVEKMDKFLVENILNNDSEYIINWALVGLERFINNNYEFSYCEDVEQTREHYKIVSDSVFAFINEKYDITGDKKDRIAVTVLKNEYLNYCTDEGIRRPVEKKQEFIGRCKNIQGLEFGKVGVDCIKGLKPKEKIKKKDVAE